MQTTSPGLGPLWELTTWKCAIYGRTGMKISILGFGCGAVGGLMVRGAAADQEKAIGRALDAGINYFDTAVQYGNGASETNLGRTLKALKPSGVFVGTKVRLPAADFGRIAAAVTQSLDGSLARLQMDHVDIFHLHNAITVNGGGDTLSADQVLNEVVPAFETLRKAGKTRFLGITAVGETAALLRVIDAKKFDSAQVSYNMLNPSAGRGAAGGLSGAGLRPDVRSHAKGRRGRRRHPGDRGRRAERVRATPSDRLAAAGADRHRVQL